MSGLGGLNKTPDGVVIGLVQLQLPTIAAKSDLAAQTKVVQGNRVPDIDAMFALM